MPGLHRLAPASPHRPPGPGGRKDASSPRPVEPLCAAGPSLPGIRTSPGRLAAPGRPLPGDCLAGGTDSPSLIPGARRDLCDRGSPRRAGGRLRPGPQAARRGPAPAEGEGHTAPPGGSRRLPVADRHGPGSLPDRGPGAVGTARRGARPTQLIRACRDCCAATQLRSCPGHSVSGPCHGSRKADHQALGAVAPEPSGGREWSRGDPSCRSGRLGRFGAAAEAGQGRSSAYQPIRPGLRAGTAR
jgi:hypothetical protein